MQNSDLDFYVNTECPSSALSALISISLFFLPLKSLKNHQIVDIVNKMFSCQKNLNLFLHVFNDIENKAISILFLLVTSLFCQWYNWLTVHLTELYETFFKYKKLNAIYTFRTQKTKCLPQPCLAHRSLEEIDI